MQLTATRLKTVEQAEELLRDVEYHSVVEKEYWYMIGMVWWKQFIAALEKKEIGGVGPIDNADITVSAYQEQGGHQYAIRPELVEKVDYTLVPESVFTVLRDTYGVVMEERDVQKFQAVTNFMISEPFIEIYPTILKVQTTYRPVPAKYKVPPFVSIEDIKIQMARVTSSNFDGNVNNVKFFVDHEGLKKYIDFTDGSFMTTVSKDDIIYVECDGSPKPKSLFDTPTVTPEKEEMEKPKFLYSQEKPKLLYSQAASSTSASGSRSPFPNGLTLTKIDDGHSNPIVDSDSSEDGCCNRRTTFNKPGVCGLQNLGNTCFMNSALQCLSNVPELTNYFVTGEYNSHINTENVLGTQGQLARSYGKLIQDMWSGNNSTVVPRNFKNIIGRFAPRFSGYQQQDSQELLACLLDALHEDLNKITKKPYFEEKDGDGTDDAVVASENWRGYLTRNDSVIVDYFHGQLKSTLVCPECSKISVKFDPFCFLSVPIPTNKDKMSLRSRDECIVPISDCFDLFTTEEQLGEDDSWYCPQCKEFRQATKKLDLWKLPDILIVHLKRFQYTRWYREKIDSMVEFPVRGLNLTDLLLDKSSGKEYVYDLIAISKHSGGLGGGHYTAVGLNGGTWYNFNDSYCSEMSPYPEKTKSREAYMLVYRRRGISSPKDDQTNGNSNGNGVAAMEE